MLRAALVWSPARPLPELRAAFMLIAPVLGPPVSLGWGLPPRCEVCRIGCVCAACFHSWGAFLVCSLCATQIATALVVRVAFAQDPELPDPLPLA